MNVKDTKLDKSRIELQIEVPSDRVDSEYKTVFEKIRQTAKIDGFRKGKAPQQILEKRYMEYATEEVAESLMKSSLVDAVKEKDINPVAAPVYEFETLERGNPFMFKATIDVYPTTELGEYKGISVEEKVCNVTEADIEKEIETIRQQFQKNVAKGPGSIAEKGDMGRISFKRLNDEGDGKLDGYSSILGEGDDEYAMEQQVVGMTLGEEKEVTIKYPEDYSESDLAGKEITYTVKIEELSGPVLPELNDEFAVEAQFESMEDMRQKAREVIDHYIVNKTRGEAKADIINTVVENSTFDIPVSMVKSEMDSVLKRQKERLAMRMGISQEVVDGYTMEDVAAITGLYPDDFKKHLEEEAEKSVKTMLVLSEVIKREMLKVTDEKYRELLGKYAGEVGKTAEEFEQMVANTNFREGVERELIMEQAVDFLYENANVKKLDAVSVDELLSQQ